MASENEISPEDVRFQDFLRAQLASADLTVERLPLDTMTKTYRLHRPGLPPLFCKRGIINPKMAAFLRSLPDDPIVIPLFCKSPLEFQGETVLVFSWRDLRHVPLAELTESQFETFVDSSQRLYGIMKGSVAAREPFDADRWMEIVRDYCRTKPLARLFLGAILKMNPLDYRYPVEASALTVTHGDLQTGNFGFDEKGRVVFLDFDLMIHALPAEDYTLLVYSDLRRSSVLRSPFRRRALIARYGQLVNGLPYASEDWRIALNRMRLRNAAERILIRGGSLKAAYEFVRRDLPVRCLYGVLAKVTGRTVRS